MIDDGLAPRTAGHAHRLLGKALHDAEISGLVGRNVARLVKAPRVPHQEMNALDADQAHQLLSAAVGDRLEVLYLLALSIGVVRIRRTLLRTPTGLTFAKPKTATSRRAIPIGRATVAALRAHRQCQVEERLSELVFANTLGGPINAGEMLRAGFYPLLRRGPCRASAFTTCGTPRRP